MQFHQDRTWDWRIRAFESAKNDIARRAYMVTVLCAWDPDKSGQVRTGVKYYFSSTVSPTLFKFGPPPNLRAVSQPYLARNSTTLRSGGIRASSRFSWRKVWTGVKWNFSSAHHHVRKIVGKLSIRRVRMRNFTRKGPKTKKLWLSIVPARRPSKHTSLGPPPKRCELQLFLAGIRQVVRR